MNRLSSWSFLLSFVALLLLGACLYFGTKRPSQPDRVFESLMVICFYGASGFLTLAALTVAVIGRCKLHPLSSLAICLSILILMTQIGALFLGRAG
jgi:hypothetical protein